jgi:hypothetical protein
MSRILPLLVALAVWTAPAAGGEFSVAGVRLGDPRETVVERVPSAKCYVHWDGAQVTAEQCATPEATLDDPVFSLCIASFHIDPKSRRVFSILIEIPKARLGIVVNGLKSKHGQPAVAQSVVAKKRGARGDALVWDVDSARVVVDMYPSESITFIAVVMDIGRR